MKILILLTIFSLMSCNEAKKEQVPETKQMAPKIENIEFAKSYFVDGENIKGRVFYIHYINGSAALMNEGFFGQIKQGMIDKGYQVVTFNCPHVFQDSFKDGGYQYRDNFLAYMEWLVETTNKELGEASELIVGGVSFGGMHTYIAAANMKFDRYFTVVSVTDPGQLNQFWQMDIPAMNVLNYKERLLGQNALHVWGNKDEIVNHTLNKYLTEYLSGSSEEVNFESGHEVEQDQVDAVLEWL